MNLDRPIRRGAEDEAVVRGWISHVGPVKMSRCVELFITTLWNISLKSASWIHLPASFRSADRRAC